MIEKIKQLLWNFKILALKIKYPKAGLYTRCFIATGTTLEEIDIWLKDYELDANFDGTIHERREYCCEEELSCY